MSRWIQEAMMRMASKILPHRNLPEELGVYLLQSTETLAKESTKAAMDRNGLALDLGNDKTIQVQDEGVCGRNTSVMLFDQDMVEPACGNGRSNL